MVNGLYLDHLLIAVRDLNVAAQTFGDNLGFSVTPEGVHPGRGSHNRLIVFGPEYLELISVSDPSRRLFRPNLVPFLESREGLFAFAMGTAEIGGWFLQLRQRGVAVDEPVDGARHTAEGATAYSWRQAEIAPDETPGSQTFLIQHHQTVAERYPEPREATKHANGVTGVHYLALAVYDAEAAAARWQEAFGLEALPAQDRRGQGIRRVRLDLKNCFLDFVSAVRPGPLTDFLARNGQAPYELGLEVSDLSEAVACLSRREVPTMDAAALVGQPAVMVDPEYVHGVSLVLLGARQGH